MSYQLIYTSAAELLEPGQTGFGTVACSRGLSRGLMKRIENLCIYKTDSLISGAQYTYRIIDCIGKTYHIFSRAVKCRPDYSGRDNYIIHQIIFLKEELRKLRNSGHVITPSGLFLSLLDDDFWMNEWAGAPRYIEQEPYLQGRSSGDAYDHAIWKKLTGHRSNSNILNNPPYEHDCLLTIPSGINSQDILQLLNESDAMSAKLGWDKTFTSHGEIQDSFSETQRIAVSENSPLENRARRTGRPILRINQELHLPALERDLSPSRPEHRNSSSSVDNKPLWQGPKVRATQKGSPHAQLQATDSESILKKQVDVVLESKKSRLNKLVRRSKNKARKVAITVSSIIALFIVGSLIYHIKEDSDTQFALEEQKQRTILAELENIKYKINNSIHKDQLRNHISSLDTNIATALSSNNQQASAPLKNENYEEALTSVKEILLKEIEKINQQISLKNSNLKFANYPERMFNQGPDVGFAQKNVSYQQSLQSFKEILAEQYHPINTRLKLFSLNKQLEQSYQSPMLAQHQLAGSLEESVRILSAARKGNLHEQRDLKHLISNAEKLRLSTHSIARLYLELNASPAQFVQSIAANNSSTTNMHISRSEGIKTPPKAQISPSTEKKITAIIAGAPMPEKLQKLFSRQPCILENGQIIASSHEQPNLGIQFSPDGEQLHIESIGPNYYRLTINSKSGINTGNLMQLYASDKFQGFLMNGLPSFLELSVEYPSGNESYIFLPFYTFPIISDEDTKPISIPEKRPIYIDKEDLLICNDTHINQQHTRLELSEAVLQSYPWKSVSMQIPLKKGESIKLPKLPGFLKSELINIDAHDDDSLAPQAVESLSWEARPKAQVELLSVEYIVQLNRKIDFGIPLREAFNNIVNKAASSPNAMVDDFYSIATLYSTIKNMENMENMERGKEKRHRGIAKHPIGRENSTQAKAYSDYLTLLKHKEFNAVLADIFKSAPQYYLSTSLARSSSMEARKARKGLELRLSIPSTRDRIAKLIREYIQNELSQVYHQLSESVSKDYRSPSMQLELKKVEAGEGLLRWFFKLQKSDK